MNDILCRIIVIFILLGAIVIPGQAAPGYDTSKLHAPVVPVVDYSNAPLGTVDALGVYVQSLLRAAGELIRFINSIFEMLGIADDANVKELMEMYDKWMEMVDK